MKQTLETVHIGVTAAVRELHYSGKINVQENSGKRLMVLSRTENFVENFPSSHRFHCSIMIKQHNSVTTPTRSQDHDDHRHDNDTDVRVAAMTMTTTDASAGGDYDEEEAELLTVLDDIGCNA